MKKLILFLFSFQLLFSSAHAVTQITSFGYPYRIVADNVEWNCSVLTTTCSSTMTNFQKASNSNIGKYIKGESKSLPMRFELVYVSASHNLFRNTPAEVLLRANGIFAQYAMDSNSVIRNVSVTGDSKTYYHVKADFFDNKSPGHISLFAIPNYIMFVELRTELFDESTRDFVMSKSYELITPLFNPKEVLKSMGIDIEAFSDCIIIEG